MERWNACRARPIHHSRCSPGSKIRKSQYAPWNVRFVSRSSRRSYYVEFDIASYGTVRYDAVRYGIVSCYMRRFGVGLVMDGNLMLCCTNCVFCSLVWFIVQYCLLYLIFSIKRTLKVAHWWKGGGDSTFWGLADRLAVTLELIDCLHLSRVDREETFRLQEKVLRNCKQKLHK